jgi:hypothetical protein
MQYLAPDRRGDNIERWLAVRGERIDGRLTAGAIAGDTPRIAGTDPA